MKISEIMKKVLDRSNRFMYVISIICLFIILFGFLQPSIRASLPLPKSRNADLQHLVDYSKTNNTINSHLFWETREFYDPGSFRLDKKGFDPQNMQNFVDNMNVVPQNSLLFLVFDSSTWKSLEILTSETTIQNIKVDKKNAEILLDTPTDLIFVKNSKMTILFIKPISIMEKTNGYLDYKEHDKKILEGKNWMVYSEVLL